MSVCFSLVLLSLMFSTLLISYMNIWSPILGIFSRCRKDVENEYDAHAVAIEKKHSYGQPKFADHVPLLYSKVISVFLTLSDTSVHAGGSGHGGGAYGLEIPVSYHFYGSMLNCVPYVLTCQCALRVYVLTYLRANIFCVLRCLACFACLRSHVL